jgi:hypothetical protein
VAVPGLLGGIQYVNFTDGVGTISVSQPYEPWLSIRNGTALVIVSVLNISR